MNTFDDDNELGLFEEPRRRPPRDRPDRSGQRRPQRGGPNRPGPRRQRPPAGSNSVLRLAGLIALGIAIVFGLVLACSGQSKQDYTSYFTAMKHLAHDSASVGPEFATKLKTSGLTPEAFKADLVTWSQQELTDYLAAQRLQPPGPLQSVHAEALTALQLRRAGLAALANTLDALSQSKHTAPSVAGAELANAAQRLSASDIVWEEYRGEATEVLKTQNVTAVIVPGSQIVTSPDIVSAHSLGTLYQRVHTPTGGGGHGTAKHGSALLYTNVVENGVSTQLSKSTSTTVSCCTNLVIAAVVEDSGNSPEANIPVVLTIKAAGVSVYTKTVDISQIAPTEQQTVSFSNITLPTSAYSHGASISVSVTKVKGEAHLDNNAATYPVLFQLASPN